MAFTTVYSYNIKKDATLAAEKQWVVDVLRLPTTVAATGNVGAITTGPLSTGGSATANRKHGDGTAAGFATIEDALEKAFTYMRNDMVLNGVSN